MAKRRSNAAVLRKMEALPALIAKHVLPGATRAGARVIAEEAKVLLNGRRADSTAGSVLIADSVKVRSRKSDGLIVARVLLAGPGAYVGRWLEFGTSAHFISVDPDYRQGMTARRINKRVKDGDGALRSTLMINGKAVGATVFHKGSDPYPFLYPAFDLKQAEARATARAYIAKRVSGLSVIGTDEGDDE